MGVLQLRVDRGKEEKRKKSRLERLHCHNNCYAHYHPASTSNIRADPNSCDNPRSAIKVKEQTMGYISFRSERLHL